MMKRAFAAVILILCGCSTDPAEKESGIKDKKTYPGMMTKPSADNRRTIMSGERPDWEADERSGVKVIAW